MDKDFWNCDTFSHLEINFITFSVYLGDMDRHPSCVLSYSDLQRCICFLAYGLAGFLNLSLLYTFINFYNLPVTLTFGFNCSLSSWTSLE